MNCQIRQLAFLQKDNSELSDSELEHLAGCPACRQFVDTANRARRYRPQYSPAEPDPGLDAMVKLEARNNRRSDRSLIFGPWRLSGLTRVATLAAGLLIVLSLWIGFQASLYPEKEIMQATMTESEQEAWAAALSMVHDEYRMKSVALWLDEFEQEMWLLEAELHVTLNNFEKHTENWYAEVNY